MASATQGILLTVSTPTQRGPESVPGIRCHLNFKVRLEQVVWACGVLIQGSFKTKCKLGSSKLEGQYMARGVYCSYFSFKTVYS